MCFYKTVLIGVFHRFNCWGNPTVNVLRVPAKRPIILTLYLCTLKMYLRLDSDWTQNV